MTIKALMKKKGKEVDRTQILSSGERLINFLSMYFSNSEATPQKEFQNFLSNFLGKQYIL